MKRKRRKSNYHFIISIFYYKLLANHFSFLLEAKFLEKKIDQIACSFDCSSFLTEFIPISYNYNKLKFLRTNFLRL